MSDRHIPPNVPTAPSASWIARKALQLGAKNKGPWAESRPEMILKTSVRRLEKWLPKSPAVMFAASVDEQPAERFPDEEIAGLAESAASAEDE